MIFGSAMSPVRSTGVVSSGLDEVFSSMKWISMVVLSAEANEPALFARARKTEALRRFLHTDHFIVRN